MDTTKTTTHIGLCAGYGGIELGLKRVIPNLRSVALCEIEAFACANLVAKMESGLMEPAPIWTDLKSFPWESFRDRVDILTGGYPCQPFSAAGKRLGTEDPRHLWPYIASGIRILRPKLCFFENVEGHISLGLREVIGELESIGYTASWGIFSASEVGAPHQRKRVFILANRHGERGQLPDWWREPAKQVPVGYGEAWRDGQWPSRPGEPQHAWEPPRVVGGSVANSNSNEPSEGRGDNAEVSEVSSEQWKDNGSIISGGESELSGEEVLGNSSQRQDHGRESRDMGQTAGEGRCGDYAADGTSEVLGNVNSPRPQERTGQRGAGIQGTHANGGADAEWQTQPTLGRDADGPARGMDYAELCTSCDNRTDELRLLGNGVVPATAERAFRTLLEELNT